MHKNQRRLLPILSALTILPLCTLNAFAATPIDLSHQNISILHSLISAPEHKDQMGYRLQEIRRNVDFKNTLHLRVQELYRGYPVFGADAIIHIPSGSQFKGNPSVERLLNVAAGHRGSLDGTVYKNIQADLMNTPAFVFNSAQAQKALTQAIAKVDQHATISDQQTKLMVYIDDKNKAHWAYKVNFYVQPIKEGVMPSKPVYLMDATTLSVYENWDDIKTIETEATFGGGYGGNQRSGKFIYDGLKDHLTKLSIMRDTDEKKCYLKNDEVTIKHYRGGQVPSFDCTEVDPQHNKVYWDDAFHSVNGGYSPDNDALFGGKVIKDMYQKWYGVPVLVDKDKPMMLNMVVHDPIDNAYWDGKKMTFGDGIRMFYPLTSLDVAGHEISHGFTEQHSDLVYYGQSGGINEAFSDMASQASEYFAFGKNDWLIGGSIFKKENEALRYMDQPSKDCKGKKPGSWCSIDDATQYYSGLDVHFSSGVYNHFFYLLGTSKNWTTKEAFDVMVHANMNYWTSRTNFSTAACGVLKAAKDLNYDLNVIKDAFTKVKIKTDDC